MTDKEWLEQIKSVSDKELMERLEWCGHDGYLQLKEQTMSNHVCGECRFHKYYALRNLDFLGITIEEWYCDNLDSRRSGQITQYNDTCERWAKEGADDDGKRYKD